MNLIVRKTFTGLFSVCCLSGIAQGIKGVGGLNQLNGSNINSITTAVPFLMIAPDSRAQGMGDAGAATSPDVNAIAWNPSKLAFAENPVSFSVSYTPWLRELVPDINLAYISGYYKPDKDQAYAGSLRYFSLGNITFTDNSGYTVGQFRPNEFALDGSYARKLGPQFSGGITARYIYSDLTNGVSQGAATHAGTAFAVDLSCYYQNTKLKVGGNKATYAFGLDLSNMGNKIAYTTSANRDFLPINLRLGNSLTLNFDEFNSLSFALDMNKLMVPTPPIYATDPLTGAPIINPVTKKQEIAAGQDPNVSVPAGMFGSFTDAPGGAQEELRSINFAFGMEYWYDKQFALRSGFFYEDPTKGNRKFFTLGVGLKYNVFAMDFAYLVPTDQRNPLQNTLCFSLFFNFDALKSSEEGGSPSTKTE